MRTSSILVLLVCIGSAFAATYKTYDSANMKKLGADMTFSYKVDGEFIYWKIERTTAGFLAIGLGKSMYDADIVLIQKPSSDTVLTIQDCKQKSGGAPECSGSSSRYTWATSATESFESTSTSFTAEIKRKLKYSGISEEAGVKNFVNGDNVIIWSYTTDNTIMAHTPSTRGIGIISVSSSILNSSSSIFSVFTMLASLLSILVLVF